MNRTPTLEEICEYMDMHRGEGVELALELEAWEAWIARYNQLQGYIAYAMAIRKGTDGGVSISTDDAIGGRETLKRLIIERYKLAPSMSELPLEKVIRATRQKAFL